MEKNYKKIMMILGAVALIGALAWGYQLYRGLIVTNMRNPFSWGLYVAMWAFFVGTAAGGLVVSSAIYLFKAKQLKPIAKVASLTAFIFSMGAMIILLPDIGRPERLYHMILHPNFSSMLPWDFIVLSAYSLVSAVYSYVLMRTDIMEKGVKLPFIGLVMKKDVSGEQLAAIREQSEKYAKCLAPVALPLAILIHTVTAWVLATQLSRPWWYGGVLAPTFIAAALATGPAIVILASMVAFGYKEKLKDTYALLAKVSAIASIIMLFIYYNDFMVRYWWRTGKEFEALKMVFTHYPLLHITEVVFILLAVYLFFKYPREKKGLIQGSLSITIGVFAHRFLLIPPAYNLIPLRVPVITHRETVEWAYPIAVGEVRGSLLNPEPVFSSFWKYTPSLAEVAITAGVVAVIGLIFMCLINVLPVKEAE
ncbi:MAG: polysulfide reductase NrfD [Nitrospirales bacterium]|nr:polysulfide reductase NrfD [Nitrospirales bacterium]